MRRASLLTATALATLPVAALAGEGHKLSFEPVPFALDDAQKRGVLVSETATWDGKQIKAGYHVLARSGDMIGGTGFAILTDETGAALTDAEGSAVSADADFTSLLPAGNGKVWSISHFEARPGAMYLTELSQDEAGKLTPVSTRPVDFSSMGGLWVPCAGSVSPWNTHLGSEEYPADARAHEEATSLDQVEDYNKPMVRYMGLDPATMTIEQFKTAFDPYKYGYVLEVAVDETGNPTPSKHYAMGRVAIELSYVMPDQKTAYITDDGTNTGLFKFVADKAGDLSAGTLYAAKWNQTSDEGVGAADIAWVDLGHSDDATIRAAIDEGTKFSDLFETSQIGEDGKCAEGFSPSNANGDAECLKIKDGMEALASRLETRRVASMRGATTEFRKMEGITYNPDDGVMYLAMSEVAKGMEAGNKADLGGLDAVRVAKNACGAVYELGLDGMNVVSAKGLVSGRPTEYADGTMGAGNSCDIDGIANPDNISYIPGTGVLLIGEDTGEGHQNDVVWSLDVASGDLTRIMSTPYGSETTSVYWHGDVNGHAYITAVIQHPFGESDEDKLQAAEEGRAYVGYIGPFPSTGMLGQ